VAEIRVQAIFCFFLPYETDLDKLFITTIYSYHNYAYDDDDNYDYLPYSYSYTLMLRLQ
jgi:hypothetical protein